MSEALTAPPPSSRSLPLVLALCLFQEDAVETLPFLSVTTTWASPVASLVTLNATRRDSLVSSAIFAISRSLRTTWSKNSSSPPPEEAFAMAPFSRIWNVLGSPSVSR